jgi:alkyl-hydroperoxide reductase/thiol specific antioxidant family protein
VAQLCQHWYSFESSHARAVVITFGAAPLARAWLTETEVPFELWLDPERAAYRAFGLEQSLVRSWSPRTIWAYIRLMVQGRPWRGIQGDSGQLGGDFVVDTGGIIRFAYRSHDPTDRPSVEDLLGAFDRLSP